MLLYLSIAMFFCIAVDSIGRWAYQKKTTMAKIKRRIKIWAERHALAIAARFALTAIWPMVAIGVAMIVLAALIVLIAAIPDAPVA